MKQNNISYAEAVRRMNGTSGARQVRASSVRDSTRGIAKPTYVLTQWWLAEKRY